MVFKLNFYFTANYVAENLLNLMKPLFGEEFNKMQIYGTNSAKWLPVILKNIPRNQLPEWYGGIKEFKPVEIYA